DGWPGWAGSVGAVHRRPNIAVGRATGQRGNTPRRPAARVLVVRAGWGNIRRRAESGLPVLQAAGRERRGQRVVLRSRLVPAPRWRRSLRSGRPPGALRRQEGDARSLAGLRRGGVVAVSNPRRRAMLRRPAMFPRPMDERRPGAVVMVESVKRDEGKNVEEGTIRAVRVAEVVVVA